MGDLSIYTIFITGLLTGGLTCLAVQGGLLATAIGQRQAEAGGVKNNIWPIAAFLLAKLLAYTVLGLLLGWFGSLFDLSLTVRAMMQMAIAIFMIGTALSLLQIHPIFNYFIIQPPRWLLRRVRQQAKSEDFFTPAILGLFTIFIPCATTQAMMALAMASGQAATGALIMFIFILGTSPLFFVLGYAANKLGERWQKGFRRVAGTVIIVLALLNINSVLAMTGSTNTLSSMAGSLFKGNSGEQVSEVVNEVTIDIQSRGYSPAEFSVKAGQPVILHLVNNNGYSCAQAFTIPKLNISALVQPGETQDINFIAPETPGKIAFSCSMGMYRGVINVVE